MLEIIFSLQNTNVESYLAGAAIRYRERLPPCHALVLLDLLQAALSELLNGILFSLRNWLVLGRKIFRKGTMCMELLIGHYTHS